jgi:hypothetical protein
MSFNNKNADHLNRPIETVPEYRPLSYHWFYKNGQIWTPLSFRDSNKLEATYLQKKLV